MKRREKNLLLAEKEPDDIETWVCRKKNDQLRTDITVVTKRL